MSFFFSLPFVQDSSQMLFRPCGAVYHDNECREPVINFSEDTRCVLHTMMPPFLLSEQVCSHIPSYYVERRLKLTCALDRTPLPLPMPPAFHHLSSALMMRPIKFLSGWKSQVNQRTTTRQHNQLFDLVDFLFYLVGHVFTLLPQLVREL